MEKKIMSLQNDESEDDEKISEAIQRRQARSLQNLEIKEMSK